MAYSYISRDVEHEAPEAEVEVEVELPPPGKRTLTSELASKQHQARLRSRLRSAAAANGDPLPAQLARRLGKALGRDLSGVRVHTGAAPAEAAHALGARAYTMGQEIYFGAGFYDPTSSAGERLLAHEVAHTVQQHGASTDLDADLAVSQPGDALESQAERFAQGFIGGSPEAVAPVSAGVVARSVIQADALEGLSASWFEVSGQAPQPTGQLTTEVTPLLIKVKAPQISGKFTVSIPEKKLPKDKKLESPLPKVGMIQTLTSMTRTAVYRLGASGAEKSVAHSRGQTRDAVETASDRDPNGAKYAPEPPFYQPAEELGTVGNVGLDFKDQPVFPVLTQLESGEKLIGTRGSDNFNTSVGAKRGGSVVTMSPFGWSVNWESQFEADQIKTDPKKNAVAIDRMVKEGIYVFSDDYVNKLERETFDSVDAAMTVPTHALLELMLKVKARGDSQSAANLATAMDRKNPTISIDVKLLESPSFWPGDDTVNVWAEGSKQTATKALTMSEGGHSKMTCKWTDVFSAATVTRASTLTIWGGVKDKLGASIDVAFPFNSGGGSIGGNDGADGKIQFTMTMA